MLDRIKSLKSLGLKGLIKREDLIIQKADKSNTVILQNASNITVVITERTSNITVVITERIKYNGSYYRTHQIFGKEKISFFR